MGGGGGGPSNSTSTVNQRNIPPELVPYYQMVLNGMAGQIFATNKNPNPMAGYTMDTSQPTVGHTATPLPVLTQTPTPAIVPGKGGYASGGITSLARGGEVKHYVAGGTTLSDAVQKLLGTGKASTDAQAIIGLNQPVAYNTLLDVGAPKTDFGGWVASQTAMQDLAHKTATDQKTPGQLTNATDQAIAANNGYAATVNRYNTLGAGEGKLGQTGYDIGNSAGIIGSKGATTLGNDASGYGLAGSQAGNMGQLLGTAGGSQYGAIGADYGKNASNLANTATQAGFQSQGYGDQAVDYAKTQANATSGMADTLAGTESGMGQTYKAAATDTANLNSYMNPYLQDSLKAQTAIMDQGNDITKAKNDSAAAQAGAYGGSRSLVQNTLSDEANTLAKNQLVANGYNQAYNTAQQNISQGAQLDLAGNQAANSALGTQLQAGQLGLAGYNQGVAGNTAAMQGVNTANSTYQTGIQGAGMGLQGVNTVLQGTAQGMQGAGLGLQGVTSGVNAGQLGLQSAGTAMQGVGVQQAGYNQVAQTIQGKQNAYAGELNSASTLGSLGQSTLADQQSIMGNQMQYGTTQQQMNQQDINNRIGVWNQQQTQPMNNLVTMGNMLNGVNTSNTTMYAPPPSILSSIAGPITAGIGAYGAATKAKGGVLKSKNEGKGVGDLAVHGAAKYMADKESKGGKGSGKGIGDLAVYNALKGGK